MIRNKPRKIIYWYFAKVIELKANAGVSEVEK
jgi:hypothetical protein